jgi:uncharacterized protein YciI
VSTSSLVYFAVRRARGPAWDPSRSLREQVLWQEHADFMDALAAEGFVVLGGPIGGDGEVLLVIASSGPEEARARLDADPWSQAGLLEIARVERWTILLDGRRAPPGLTEARGAQP